MRFGTLACVAAFGALAFCAGHASAQASSPPQVLRVGRLDGEPVVDGVLGEWGRQGWLRVPVAPAVEPARRPAMGLAPARQQAPLRLVVELKAGLWQDRIYIAARWPDDTRSEAFRPWVRTDSGYVESDERDDAFALRLPMRGDFDRSMLSGANYEADVWHWTAGRSNVLGLAEDMRHVVGTRVQENAAEYAVRAVGTVYVRKHRDAGDRLYRNLRPQPGEHADRVRSIELTTKPAGSIADVSARGRWARGYWHLELTRKLDTGHADDASLHPGIRIPFQIAVFNRASDENKSVSEIMLLEIAPAR